MEKIFRGKPVGELLQIDDKLLQAGLTAPGAKDILYLGLITLVLLSLVSFLDSDASVVDMIEKVSASDYQICNQLPFQGKTIQETPEPCGAVIREIQSNGILDERAYAKYKVAEYRSDPLNPRNFLLEAGFLVFIISALLAAAKKAYPLFLTNIEDKVMVEYTEKRATRMRIGSKTIKPSIFSNGYGLRFKKYPSGISMVSFFTTGGIKGMIRFEPMAGRMFAGPEVVSELVAFLNFMENIRIESGAKTDYTDARDGSITLIRFKR